MAIARQTVVEVVAGRIDVGLADEDQVFERLILRQREGHGRSHGIPAIVLGFRDGDVGLVHQERVIACAAVVVVLFLGLWNMISHGDANTSQRLMRLRVIAQAIAVLLLMGALFFFGGNRGS